MSMLWQPIKTAPKDRPVLVWIDGAGAGDPIDCCCVAIWDKSGYWQDSEGSIQQPTFWMPVEPPA